MKIAVILVNMFEGRHEDAMQPILFAILDALSPGHTLHFYDERIRPLPEGIDADLFALSVDTFSAARAYRLADILRAQGKTVVLGGIHPTSVPDEAQAHADAVIVGEAEDTWPELLADAEQGCLQKRYVSEQPPLVSFDPGHPALQKGYLPLGIMETSRGCPHTCDFCSVKVLYPGRVRRKPLAMIETEIARSPHRLLFFVDDNLYSDRAYFLALLQILKNHKKRWAAQVSVNITGDASVLDAAKDAGCVLLLMGFESLHKDALQPMGKMQNLQTDLAQAAAAVHQKGMLLYATFVFGYDTDTAQRVREVEQFANHLGIAVVNFNPLQPMPGTPLYKRLQKKERLQETAWWLDSRYRYGQMAFEPKEVSGRVLSEEIADARRRFYGRRNTLRRWLRNPAAKSPVNTGLHFLLSHVSRKEIRRKEGRLLHANHTD
ncbi:MAG: B12-binding domain-containing radical SAM protein [Peptoniphilaceae bacterium]|jgi:radical SAM superfamily enzyme YgiQ (UPF0313 family)|nr:radical SAM protein [Bacillota bacterium]